MPRFKPCGNSECSNLIGVDELKKYCSSKCRQRAYRLRLKSQPKKAQPKLYHPPRLCDNCGRSFEPRRRDQRFCCVACRQAVYRQLKKLEAAGDDVGIMSAAVYYLPTLSA